MDRKDSNIEPMAREVTLQTNRSRVIYGDSPFIEDMGMLTSLCLLHDEVMLIGNNSLDEELESYWEGLGERAKNSSPTVVEQAIQILLPESVVSYYSASDAKELWDDDFGKMNTGISFGEFDDSAQNIPMYLDPLQQTDLTDLLLNGISGGSRTVNAMLRDVNILSVSFGSRIPILSKGGCIVPVRSKTFVSEAANHLANVAVRALVLPELEAYRAEDILEARLKLAADLQAFRAGILDLVWVLYERSGLIDDLAKFHRDCEVLVSTKLVAALSSLEAAIQSHQNKGIRRILKTTGGVFMELGKASLGGGFPGFLLGVSGAALKVSEHMEASSPTVPIASYLYKIREKNFR